MTGPTGQDDRIAALFRDAASGAPPPAFDHARVVATSRRITARRRAAVVSGSLVLLAVIGVGSALGLPGSSRDLSSAAAPAMAPETGPGRQEAAPGLAPGDTGGSGVPGVPDVSQSAGTPPLGPGTGDCALRQDPALRALVEQVLPEVAGAREAAVTMECRPPGERGVNLEVGTGLLTVQYLPPGAAADSVPGGASVVEPTASGGTVVVSARAGEPGGAVPLEDRLGAAAAFLAPRL